jgi:glutathione S-transferase
VTLDFKDCVVIISLRSPFARRVRLALREAGIPHEERVVDVLKPAAELIEKNPLARVPVVALKSGCDLLDSNTILQLFHEAHPSPLFPKPLESRMQVMGWGVLAAGVCEKIVEYYFDTMRPVRDAELDAETRAIIDRVLARVESAIGSRETMVGDSLTQADLDLGTMLRYISLRHSDTWRAKFPSSARYLEALEKRPSFRATVPPPA